MGNENIEKWSTLKEVQAYLGVGRETILQWIAKRNMPAYKVGKLWKFKLSEVDDWIRSGGAADESIAEDYVRFRGQYLLYDKSSLIANINEARKELEHGQSSS